MFHCGTSPYIIFLIQFFHLHSLTKKSVLTCTHEIGLAVRNISSIILFCETVLCYYCFDHHHQNMEHRKKKKHVRHPYSRKKTPFDNHLITWNYILFVMMKWCAYSTVKIVIVTCHLARDGTIPPPQVVCYWRWPNGRNQPNNKKNLLWNWHIINPTAHQSIFFIGL